MSFRKAVIILAYGKSVYLVNLPQFKPEFLKVGRCVQLTRDSKTKVEGVITECTPLELTVAYLRAPGDWEYIKVTPLEIWENKYTLLFMKK